MTHELKTSLVSDLAGDSGLWLGSLHSFIQAHSALERVMSMSEASLKLYSDYDDEDEDKFGSYAYMVQDLADGVIGVHINGSLVTQNRYWNRYIGQVSYEEIINAMSVAAQHNPSDIIMMVKSPGGAAQGISEASDHIEMVKKSGIRVSTHTGSVMASGGYWLGSNGSPVVASRMAEVGSVGVISVHMEYTEMLKKMGISPTVMRTSEYKALGTPYEKFDDKAKGEHMRRMEGMHDLFLEHIAEQRGMAKASVSANIATGQVFLGQEALKIGAIDRVGTLEELVQQLSESRPSTYTMNSGDDPMNRRILSESQAQAALEAGADPEQVQAMLDAGKGAGEDKDNPKVSEGEDANEDEDENDTGGDNDAGGEGNDGDGDGDDDKGGDEQVSDTGVGAALLAQVQDLQKQVVDLSVANSQLKAESDKAAAAMPALRQFCTDTLHRMEVAFGRSPTATENLGAEALAELCVSVNKEFCETFRVGSQSAKDTPEDGSGQAAAHPLQTHLTNVTSIGNR